MLPHNWYLFSDTLTPNFRDFHVIPKIISTPQPKVPIQGEYSEYFTDLAHELPKAEEKPFYKWVLGQFVLDVATWCDSNLIRKKNTRAPCPPPIHQHWPDNNHATNLKGFITQRCEEHLNTKLGKTEKNILDQHNSCKWGLYISSRWMLNQYGNMKLNYNYDIVPSLYTTLPSFGMRCCVSTWTTYRQRLRHSSTTTQWTPTPSKPQDLKTTNSELKHQIHNSSIKHLILDLYSSTQTNIEKLMFYVLFFISSGQPPQKIHDKRHGDRTICDSLTCLFPKLKRRAHSLHLGCVKRVGLFYLWSLLRGECVFFFLPLSDGFLYEFFGEDLGNWEKALDIWKMAISLHIMSVSYEWNKAWVKTELSFWKLI